jgi:D-arabinose 1-dehydrogenase-like Zn-dependent alcohol dehydrogenase
MVACQALFVMSLAFKRRQNYSIDKVVLAASLPVIAVISSDDEQRLRALGADEIIDNRAAGPEWRTPPVDAVIDTAGVISSGKR